MPFGGIYKGKNYASTTHTHTHTRSRSIAANDPFGYSAFHYIAIIFLCNRITVVVVVFSSSQQINGSVYNFKEMGERENALCFAIKHAWNAIECANLKTGLRVRQYTPSYIAYLSRHLCNSLFRTKSYARPNARLNSASLMQSQFQCAHHILWLVSVSTHNVFFFCIRIKWLRCLVFQFALLAHCIANQFKKVTPLRIWIQYFYLKFLKLTPCY